MISCISVSEFYQYEDGIYGRSKNTISPQDSNNQLYRPNVFTEELNQLGGIDLNKNQPIPSVTSNNNQVILDSQSQRIQQRSKS